MCIEATAIRTDVVFDMNRIFPLYGMFAHWSAVCFDPGGDMNRPGMRVGLGNLHLSLGLIVQIDGFAGDCRMQCSCVLSGWAKIQRTLAALPKIDEHGSRCRCLLALRGRLWTLSTSTLCMLDSMDDLLRDVAPYGR
jgi:hypothetical protein